MQNLLANYANGPAVPARKQCDCIDSWSNIVAYLNDVCSTSTYAIGYRAHIVVLAQIACSLKSDQRCCSSCLSD